MNISCYNQDVEIMKKGLYLLVLFKNGNYLSLFSGLQYLRLHLRFIRMCQF